MCIVHLWVELSSSLSLVETLNAAVQDNQENIKDVKSIIETELQNGAENLPGAIDANNPLDKPLDPLPPIKATPEKLEEVVGSRPKTSNPSFRWSYYRISIIGCMIGEMTFLPNPINSSYF